MEKINDSTVFTNSAEIHLLVLLNVKYLSIFLHNITTHQKLWSVCISSKRYLQVFEWLLTDGVVIRKASCSRLRMGGLIKNTPNSHGPFKRQPLGAAKTHFHFHCRVQADHFSVPNLHDALLRTRFYFHSCHCLECLPRPTRGADPASVLWWVGRPPPHTASFSWHSGENRGSWLQTFH